MKLNKIFLFSIFIFLNLKSQHIYNNIDNKDNLNIVPHKEIILDAVNDLFTIKNNPNDLFKQFDSQSQKRWGRSELVGTIYKSGWLRDNSEYFKPTVLGIIDLIPSEKYYIKLALISNDHPQGNSIQVIYNLIANYDSKNKKVNFSKFTDWYIRDWYSEQVGNILYYKRNKKTFSEQQAHNLDEFNKELSEKFGIPVKKITYFSCVDAFDVYHLKGFDYAPNMFFARHGGLVSYGGEGSYEHIIYSANDNEFYPHELSHFYIDEFSNNDTSRLASEGIATYLGGSGKPGLTYQHHLSVLNNFVKQNNIKINDMFIESKMKMIDSDVSTLYSIGALVAKIIYERNGINGWKEFLLLKESSLHKGISEILNVKESDLNALILSELNKF
ncbi:hypothetical protein [Chryseobacterium sp. G0201]|uniref:hypothetical protein n=1 Tax=Chryseobacterium sp. G0201 TaxID=2487065 RepID=UPI000F4E9D23|nr:hypothetical protein [Chryseobacterium sp. G0201]AZA55194.1 hypothetical protein EG348_20425 [Chryseobacterium sp. G0201]